MFRVRDVSQNLIVWITVGVLGLLVLLYVTPGMPPDQLELLAEYYAQLPVIVLVILGCVLASLRDQGQGRRFWQVLAAAFVCWLIADSMYAFVEETERNPLLQLFVDCVYLSMFLLILLALQLNDRGGDPDTNSTTKFFGIAGALLLSFQLLIYFIVIPYHLEPNTFLSYVPSFYLFVALNLVVAATALGLLLKTGNSGWRKVYGFIALAGILWAVADWFDSLYFLNIHDIPAGTWLDIVYYAPFISIIWATRVRGDRSEVAEDHERASSAGPGFPTLLLAYGLLGPAIHLLISAMGGAGGPTHLPREMTVLIGLFVFVSMALFQFQILRRRNIELQSTVDKLNLNEARLHRQRLESLGLLAGGVAHDFNNLLMLINGNAELTADSLPDNHPSRQHLEQIEHTVKHASNLTAQMLAYAGRSPIKQEVVDLNEIVRSIDALTSTIVGTKAELNYQLADDVLPIEVDEGQVRQVLLNLITNAVEASVENSSVIRIMTKSVEISDNDATDYFPENPRPGQYAAVEVIDEGAGMDPEIIRKIFDPFFTTKSAGSGLGLAAVLGIVEAHSGSIQVRTVPREGSRFIVYFPTSEKAPSGFAAPSKTDSIPGHGSILVVDDEQGVREIAKSMLEGDGYRVLTESDGSRALNLALQHRDSIRAVLLDVTMPGLGGEKVAQELCRQNPATPIIMMSGYAKSKIEETTLRCVAGFLGKPFVRAELLAELRRALLGRSSADLPGRH